MGLLIFGLYIDLTPVLYGFEFNVGREFACQEFGNTNIGLFRVFSRIQMGTFAGLLVFGGAFVIGNLQFDINKERKK